MPEQSDSARLTLNLRPSFGVTFAASKADERAFKLEVSDTARHQARQPRACAHGATCRMPPEQRCAGPECALVMVE